MHDFHYFLYLGCLFTVLEHNYTGKPAQCWFFFFICRPQCWTNAFKLTFDSNNDTKSCNFHIVPSLKLSILSKSIAYSTFSFSATHIGMGLRSPNRRISAQIVRSRLHSAGLRARRLLSIYARRSWRSSIDNSVFAWAMQHVRWNRQQWAPRPVFGWNACVPSSHCLTGSCVAAERCSNMKSSPYSQSPHLVEGVSWSGQESVLYKTATVRIEGNLNGNRYLNDILRPHACSAVCCYPMGMGLSSWMIMPAHTEQGEMNAFLEEQGIERNGVATKLSGTSIP